MRTVSARPLQRQVGNARHAGTHTSVIGAPRRLPFPPLSLLAKLLEGYETGPVWKLPAFAPEWFESAL